MELTSFTNPTLLPGQRLLSTKGYDGAEKYPMPRDCQAAIFDSEEDYVYIKATDTNGGVSLKRYKLEEDPIPRFEPGNYVTINDFEKFKEEVLNGINGIQQSISNARTGSEPVTKEFGAKQSGSGNGKQPNRSNS